jgi:phosphonate transport system ATP-binding protein
MLRIKGLTKRYRTGDLALKGIDIDVPDGQVMALIGPSGAGKSTVIRCVNRLVEPTSGSIELNGVDIVKLGSAELRRARRRMGMIFQEYALVERLSVMDNASAISASGRAGCGAFRNPTSTKHSVCSNASALITWPTNAPMSCPVDSASASAFAAR